MAPCSLDGLRRHYDYEREVWGGLLSNLDTRLVFDDMLLKKTGWDDPESQHRLMNAINSVVAS